MKTKKVSNYNEMLELFGRDRASGAHAETAKERNARLLKTDNIKVETISELDDLLASKEVTLENQCNFDDDIQVLDSVVAPPKPSSNAKKCKSKKRKLEQEDEAGAFNSKLVNCLDSMTYAISEGNKIFADQNEIFDRAYHREFTGEEICKELEPMGLEPNEIPDALIYLANNQAKARTLFSCPLQMRVGILKGMMKDGK